MPRLLVLFGKCLRHSLLKQASFQLDAATGRKGRGGAGKGEHIRAVASTSVLVILLVIDHGILNTLGKLPSVSVM